MFLNISIRYQSFDRYIFILFIISKYFPAEVIDILYEYSPNDRQPAFNGLYCLSFLKRNLHGDACI